MTEMFILPKFKSIVGIGETWTSTKNLKKMYGQEKIYIEVAGRKLFCGKLAENEAYTLIKMNVMIKPQPLFNNWLWLH